MFHISCYLQNVQHLTRILSTECIASNTYLLSTECIAASKQQKIDFLQQLRSLDVDLTRYLVNQQPAPIDQEVQVIDQ